jgi:hypothetical protein
VHLVEQVEWIGGSAQVGQSRLAVGRKEAGDGQAVESRHGAVVAAQGGSDRIVLLAYDPVEEVVHKPHAVVDLIEQVGLGDRVEAPETDATANE